MCSDIGGSCSDDYAGSSDHEQDCSVWGFTDDGGCSKTKNRVKVLGTWVHTSKFSGIPVTGVVGSSS